MRAPICPEWPWWGSYGILLGFIALTGLMPSSMELVVSPAAGGRPYLVVPLEPEERFTLHYMHSVDRAPIWEQHSVGASGTIYIEEERCQMFGAGMGHWAGRGTLTSSGPHLIIEDIHAAIGDFVLRVGDRDVGHTIIWRGGRVNLSRLAAGQAVVIAVRRVGLVQRMRHHVLRSVGRLARQEC